MDTKSSSLFRWGFLAAALLLVLEVRATTIKIDIDTTVLGIGGENWDLAFDLIGNNPQPNSVTIRNFEITGPNGGLTGAAGYPMTQGNVQGTLPGEVKLDDSLPSPAFISEYLDNADVGILISFVLDITGNKDSGLDPDTFSFFFVNPTTGATLPTGDPTGALFVYSIGNDDQPTLFCLSTAPCVEVSPVVVAVPEPSAAALAIAALLALGFTRAARRTAPRKALAA